MHRILGSAKTDIKQIKRLLSQYMCYTQHKYYLKLLVVKVAFIIEVSIENTGKMYAYICLKDLFMKAELIV